MVIVENGNKNKLVCNEWLRELIVIGEFQLVKEGIKIGKNRDIFERLAYSYAFYLLAYSDIVIIIDYIII